MDITLYNFDGSSAGTIPFDVTVLGDNVRVRLLHQAVKMYEANKRQGTACTKTRSQVLFTKRKPWRQKHTGRARAGDANSPIWVGGGRAFGPKPRDYSWTMPIKSRRLALRSALLSKFQDSEVAAFTGFELSEPRTRLVDGFISNTGLGEGSILFVVIEHDVNAIKSVRNIKKAAVVRYCDLNTYDVLKYTRLVFTREALALLAGEAER